AFGLRYLMANMGELKSRAMLVEFDINQRPLDIAEALLARQPRILGFGVYIWNVAETAEVLAAIKKVRPDITIILGGPEVSHETEQQAIVALADYVITGEADLAFAEVCRQILAGRPPEDKVLAAPLPEFDQLQLPYDLYTDEDIAHRVIYVEASRGCPFRCEFCLSSLDVPVRQAPLEALLEHLDRLLQRGVRHFKFVDRTFNLNLNVSRTLLQFFLERHRPGMLFHFEMIPDRLPEPLRRIIARFPPGALQFEVGIQSFNEEVCALISRRQDLERLTDNLTFLRRQTGVHVHADLIAGLPGESLESFAAGFDRLVALGPQEIQVGILKRLRGTPIVRHDEAWSMRYHPHPPYEILQNRLLDFATLQRLRRFAKYWDLVANSGNFVSTTPLFWANAPASSASARPSPFWSFLRFSDWLFARLGRTDGIALARLAEMVFGFLVQERALDRTDVAQKLWRDWQAGGRRDPPIFLREWIDPASSRVSVGSRAGSLRRQARHTAWAELPDPAPRREGDPARRSPEAPG
ncbi:MAG TPA: radical SAM protein, partial [Methylomirabilota bacterium]|nr:radical SAM protein [Methylomirabilota bacterium]